MISTWAVRYVSSWLYFLITLFFLNYSKKVRRFWMRIWGRYYFHLVVLLFIILYVNETTDSVYFSSNAF